MNNIYTIDGIRKTDVKLKKTFIKRLKSEWKSFVQTIPPYPPQFSGKGIVMCAGGLSYFTCAWIAIKAIRRSGCHLPVQLWYVGNELSSEVIKALGEMNVECENFLDHDGAPWQGFQLKPFAILHSRFEEVLYMDADNVCVTNPEALFYTEEYKQYGALFWPDFWKTGRESPIWEITGSTDYETREQESGQLLVHKEKCWKELNLCQYFNSRSVLYYQFLLGDKDTFRFAWMALNTRYYMIETDVATCGYIHPETNAFLGTTMVQHDIKGKILFLHRNLVKWDLTREHELIWQKIKQFLPGTTVRRYLLDNKVEIGHAFVDIMGEVEAVDFTDLLNDFEKVCTADLAALRRSKMYARFLIYDHLRRHRYMQNIPFQLNGQHESPLVLQAIC